MPGRRWLSNKELRKVKREAGVYGFLGELKRLELTVVRGVEVYISSGMPILFRHEGMLYPTLRVLLEHNVDSSWVAVDMGAVPHIVNGADVMAPGVVSAHGELTEGSWAWVRDVDHGKPLCVGTALMSGAEMVEARSGKAVKNLHHVGDAVWNL